MTDPADHNCCPHWQRLDSAEPCPDCELDGHLSDIADDTWTDRQERGAA